MYVDFNYLRKAKDWKHSKYDTPLYEFIDVTSNIFS